MSEGMPIYTYRNSYLAANEDSQRPFRMSTTVRTRTEQPGRRCRLTSLRGVEHYE